MSNNPYMKAKGRKVNREYCKQGSNQCKLPNGQRMSVSNRNMLMKLDYIAGGYSFCDIAEKYGVSYATVASVSKKGKWKDERKKQEQRWKTKAEEKLMDVYVGCEVEITLIHNNTWQKIINIVNEILDNPRKYLFNQNTQQFKILALDQLADIMSKAQAGQNLTTGFVSKLEKLKLELQQENLALRKRIAGEEEDNDFEDNFMDAINSASENLWGDESDG